MANDVNATRQAGNGEANVLINLAVAASANGIAVAQAVAAAGNLALAGALTSGGAYISTGARRMVAVSTNGGDTTQTITWYGTDRNGNALTEAVALNGVTPITTLNDFLTVSRIAASAALAGNITGGTSAVGSSAWIQLERFRNNPISIAVIGQLVSGAINWTLEHTYDNPNVNPLAGIAVSPGVEFPYELVQGLNVGDSSPAQAWPDQTLVALAATGESMVTAPWDAIRFTVNSGTGVFKGQVRVAAMASGLR